jgi:hypothetical protein
VDFLQALDGRKSFFMPNLMSQLTAAARKYAFVYLQIWEGKTIPWHLADVFIADVETPLS